MDTDASTPWQPVHLHQEREPLSADEIYEFNFEVRRYGIQLQPGERIGIRIKCSDADDKPKDYLQLIGTGHVSRRTAAHASIHHNGDNPSLLLLPITKGNRVGTFISGGKRPPYPPED